MERCFFCDASARHFVGEPDEARGGRALCVCDRHLVLLNVEDGSFRDEVRVELGSDRWEMGMYAARERCWRQACRMDVCTIMGPSRRA